MLPILGCIVLFLAFNVEEYRDERLGYVFLLFVLYGFAIIPFMYLFSFLFSQPAFAYAFMVILNIVSVWSWGKGGRAKHGPFLAW
jgi:ATP-binding cassette subfamily A (ABC1) protein 3